MIHLINSEFKKMWTIRTWWVMLICSLAVTLIISGGYIALALFASYQDDAGTFSEIIGGSLNFIYLAGYSWTHWFAAILGGIMITGEYRHNTITPTFLAAPRRWMAVAAKAIGGFAAALVFAILNITLSLFIGVVVAVIKGGSSYFEMTTTGRSILLGAVSVGLWFLFGLSIGTLLKNQIGTVLATVGAILSQFGLGTIVLILAGNGIIEVDTGANLLAYLPSSAHNALTLGSDTSAFNEPDSPIFLLPWWGAILTLLAYTAVFITPGILVTLRRDVT